MDYIKEYKKYLENSRQLEPNTITSYYGILSKFKDWFEKNNTTNDKFEPSNITPIDVKEYRDHLSNIGRKPRTINKALTTIKSFCNWAIKEEYIVLNPASPVRNISLRRDAPKWLERKEQLALIRELYKMNNPRNTAIVFLMLHAGLRVSEVVNLKTSDIQISDRKGLVVVRNSKLNKYREVPLNKEVRNALVEYIHFNEIDMKKDGYLFISQKGGPLTERAVQHFIKELKKRSEIEDLSPHVLRHTFAHELLKRPGVTIDMVAMLMGHMTKEGLPNIKTTMQYTTPSAGELEKAVEKLEWE